MPFFRLIRLPNLIIVAITQFLLYQHLLIPVFSEVGIEPVLPLNAFLSFILVTICISAGGFIINDILDYEVDQINKSDKLIINRKITLRNAYWLYSAFNLLGFSLALYLGFYVQNIALANIYLLAVAGLYLYSKKLKQSTLWGNFLIATYCAVVAWIVWFSQKGALINLAQEAPELFKLLQYIFIGYIFFAFTSTLFREIVKDIEDMDGDRAINAQTLPIRWGIKSAKTVAGISALVLLLGLIYMMLYFQSILGLYGLIFASLGICLPILLALLLLIRAKSTAQFHQISQLAKWIMLAGLLLLLFIKI
jgi:4-hydroxybenzoate polyprenyltransferase